MSGGVNRCGALCQFQQSDRWRAWKPAASNAGVSHAKNVVLMLLIPSFRSSLQHMRRHVLACFSIFHILATSPIKGMQLALPTEDRIGVLQC